MSTPEDGMVGDSVDHQVQEWIRAARPEGPADVEFWTRVARRRGLSPSAETRARVQDAVRAALAAARSDLTLGSYLKRLRTEARLSTREVARVAKLAPDLIAELEGDHGVVF